MLRKAIQDKIVGKKMQERPRKKRCDLMHKEENKNSFNKCLTLKQNAQNRESQVTRARKDRAAMVMIKV